MEIIIMDYSIEALIAEGTGLKTRDEMRYTSSSESAYDGYFDAVQAELTRSFENLDFLDTYSRVNEANDSAKLRMMKRLKRVYGSTIEDPAKASSVESFIDSNIRSIEEDKKGDAPAKEPGKVKAFFQRIIEALKRMLEGLKDFFKGIWKKIKELFTKKNEKNSRVATAEEIKKIVMGDGKGISDVTHDAYNKSNTNVAKVAAGDITDYMVKFDKINANSIKSAVSNILDIKTIANITNQLKGTTVNNATSLGAGYTKQVGNMKRAAGQMDALGKAQNIAKNSSDVDKLNDKDIVRVYYKTEPATPEYISKLSVKAIVNAIQAIGALEETCHKTESVVEKGIKGVEEYIKASNGAGADENTVTEVSRILRNAAKASQKVCSVGVKIAQAGYKLLIPKTDTEKKDYQSSVTADRMINKQKKTA